MTYYEILEISENASQEVIQMAYELLCGKYHPDVYFGDDEIAEKQIRRINDAYATLSDETKKKEYDDWLKSQRENRKNLHLEPTQGNNRINSSKKKNKYLFVTITIVASILISLSLLIYFVGIPYLEILKTKSLESKRLSEIKNSDVGAYITFGAYEQDGNYNNGSEAIEWLVLEKSGNKVLVISKYGLDCIPFSTEWVDDATWETSNVRNWLNKTFYDEAFNDFEKKYISKTVINNYDYIHKSTGSSFTTENGTEIQSLEKNRVERKPTQDYLYVFSDEEAEKYFATSKARKVKPTTYAKNMGADTRYGDGKHAWWWLRNNPDMNKNHSVISGKGGISTNSLPVDCETVTVRPAMWISIDDTD